MESLKQVVHATTLVTNAVIERKGNRTGLITTKGFKDILELSREVKYDLYDLFQTVPEPLVPRSRRLEVLERTKYNGEILIETNEKSLRDAIDELVTKDIESLAVCFLHSYQNSNNEDIVLEFIRK